MPPIAAASILAAFGLALIVLMLRSWRRQTQQSFLQSLPEVPQAQWSEGIEATYVSTIRAGEKFQRVADQTLGQRAHCHVRTSPLGVLIQRDGARDLFIAYSQLQRTYQAPGMIGKTVGGQGLLILHWRHLDRELETGLRIRHKQALAHLVSLLERKDVSA